MDIHSETLERLINKKPDKFTILDITAFAEENSIRMVNFMYPAADGRLKTLNFAIHDEKYLISILSEGERVDGSSLFPFIEAGNSDLYVIPRLKTGFIDPFAELPTLNFLCSFFDKDGNRLECSPEYILHKAEKSFTDVTGMKFEAMGELEYYVSAPIIPGSSDLYPATDQKGYHESGPFAKFNSFRTECMYLIMLSGSRIKYGHSEVGNFTMNGRIYEQNEIEFLPSDPEDAADSLMKAKWIIRTLGYRHGLEVSFAPKITEGKAGSGLHIHMRIMKDGRNMMLETKEGSKAPVISDIAKKAIGGMLELAPSITSFGNMNPTSYLRLVPHQEAPTSICWGDRNRSVLIRVPLGWTSGKDMFSMANPGGKGSLFRAEEAGPAFRQTVEIRSSDCSADIYMLMAAVCIACRHGLESPDSLERAENGYVDIDIHKAENSAKASSLEQLPASCYESAQSLAAQRETYQQYGVFATSVIDSVIHRLESFGDRDLRDRLKEDPELMRKLVERYYHCQ